MCSDGILHGAKRNRNVCTGNHDIEYNLRKYREILLRISRARATTNTHKLQARARNYLRTAIALGYDPERDNHFYLGL
jgi:hypothetical protein